MFTLPFAPQERFNFRMPREKFRSVSPLAVGGIGLRYQLRVAAVSAIFSGAHFWAAVVSENGGSGGGS